MYPEDVQFIFVCRGEHLRNDPSMKGKLLALAPGAIIVTIEEWVKKGPVYDVLRAYRALCAASENKETHSITGFPITGINVFNSLYPAATKREP